MAHPDGCMFSIKLVHPGHLDHPHQTDDFDGTDGRRTLMVFSSEGKSPAVAANIPVGHRAIVYVTGHQKFIWAIEYCGSVKEGRQAAVAHGIQPEQIETKWNIFLPIRILKRADLDTAPTAEVVRQRTGLEFTPNHFPMKYISEQEYQTIFRAIWPDPVG